MKIKKVLAGIMATALVAGTLSMSAAAEEPLKMGFIVGSFEHVFYNLIAEGIQEKADELGIEATILDAELDATPQIGAVVGADNGELAHGDGSKGIDFHQPTALRFR